jgi:hypothetical protein
MPALRGPFRARVDTRVFAAFRRGENDMEHTRAMLVTNRENRLVAGMLVPRRDLVSSFATLALRSFLATRRNKCSVLKEVVEHHVQEEETEFFPRVEKALGQQKLEDLAEEMAELFEDHTQQDFRAALYANLRQVLAGALKTDVSKEDLAAEERGNKRSRRAG